jgi:hypothetical protein
MAETDSVYVLIHTHQYGATAYLFRSSKPYQELDPEEIAEKLEVNFEADKGETLYLESVDLTDIPTLE